MKALAAERAEVEQEGCKPEFRTAQREMKMSMQKKSMAFADQEFSNRLMMELSQRSVIREKGVKGDN